MTSSPAVFAPPRPIGSAPPPPPGGGAESSSPTRAARPADAALDAAATTIARIGAAYDAVVVGQSELRTSLLVALIAEGHVLIESLPGMAKTTAAAVIARAIGGEFSRIQCTPDLLPSDVIGTQVYDPATTSFTTRLGPVHANVVLLDEINRSSAKTQSAMLEAMQERQTSIGGHVHPLPRPFTVLATQNPIDEEGTYLLPYAQMDRFLLKEVLDYPTPDEEVEVLARAHRSAAPAVEAAVRLDDVARLTALLPHVYVDDSIRRYAVALVGATRKPAAVISADLAAYVECGASPRGSLALQRVAQAVALLAGRTHVIPEDVAVLRHAVLRHRIRLGFHAIADGVREEAVIDAVFAAVAVP